MHNPLHTGLFGSGKKRFGIAHSIGMGE
jgi:hypothetical protein